MNRTTKQEPSPPLSKPQLQTQTQTSSYLPEQSLATRLIHACKAGQLSLVHTLLTKEGVNPNNDDQHEYERGHTALTISCDQGHTSIVKLLLSHGANIETKNLDRRTFNPGGRTPLFWAAGSGHTDVIKVLLSAGADPNSTEENGRLTPLAVAAVRGHEEAVSALLESEGVDLDRRGTPDGRTVLSHSAEDGQEEIVRRLIERGADPDSRDLLERTPLSWAAQRGQRQIVEILLDCEDGCKVDMNSKDGKYSIFSDSSPGERTPLSYAAAMGHEEVVVLLIKRGADVDYCDRGGWSALARAVFRGHVSTVRVLLEVGGAKPEIGYVLGYLSIMEYARGNESHRPGFVEINQLLRKWSSTKPDRNGGSVDWFWNMWK
ncbi:uncharacterized protein N7473_004432 [Penicillium subrubescens]|uniref:Ankyrin repeat domain-containing protein 50 n=1 Tax=Penicillium subrubescens TaxID=1316194 RepID=A0A1Q5UQJ4_9EURO|nr:uncharacterized protein N7473_004432 [Penicillium subrubescens]KAJ5900362.1 hypothetical protein N7473_004432 [Penicillium subrubescens]OKP14750.1 Ankyrin repeat domain-containing protein 50 [Penicillium subrubescens]